MSNCFILVLPQAFFSPFSAHKSGIFSRCLATRKVNSSAGRTAPLTGAFWSILAVITDNIRKWNANIKCFLSHLAGISVPISVPSLVMK